MAQEQSSSRGLAVVNLIIGAVLMVGGVMLDKALRPDSHGAADAAHGAGEHAAQWKVEFLNKLDSMGLPLNPGITVATIGVLLIVFPVIKYFYTNPLQAALDERNHNLESTFAEVESLRNEMTTMKSDYEKRIATTEAEAREKINAQIKEAQTLRQSLMAEAADKSDALIKQAQEEIAGEKAKALTEIRVHVTELALGAAEKVVNKNLDTELNRKLISDFISDLEVKK
jgi:F-type H+-transporting ATPase subunit b